ncbi:hypothetical protein CAL26_05545 [Bordetella genomosp. 9]|uniref:MmyB-like transcription regulator ligand binding domain-containing protein n=1 Tax=Bordetella genomosp. 9 TaxID=1416803 RepID=A0A261RP01_9BORD|nr:helix-turn-helix transcriptional regulator [Bordetella genomosp. 9]OZI26784.1 hypothetical protein CAL26_05545 [Bordetella genomosp. 9]
MSDRLARLPAKQRLSEFVRFCRERASPEACGFPPARRRRTAGLRREEAAALCGVGLTWYTWFEQGRDIAVSDAFLHRLAHGLRLSRAEHEHLFALAGRQVTATSNVAEVPESLRTLIATLPQAVYVMNRAWDILAFNDAATELFEDFREPNPNMLRIVLFSSRYRARVLDWERAARLILLKARHDHLTGEKSPMLRGILDDALERLPAAASWWADPEVVRIGNTVIALRQANGAPRSFMLHLLSAEDTPSLRVVICTPIQDGA